MLNLYLQNIVDVFQRIPISEYIYIIDVDLNYVMANTRYLELIGDLDLVGRKLKDSKSKFAKLAVEYKEFTISFINSDEISTKRIAKVWANDVIQFYDFRISKIIDPVSNELVGLLAIGNKLRLPAGVVNLLSKSADKVYSHFLEVDDNTNASAFEHEVIWLLIAGKTQKEIAYILSKIEQREITRSYIAAYLRRSLYPKFNVIDVSGLIAKIGDTSLMSSIPTRLLDYFSQEK